VVQLVSLMTFSPTLPYTDNGRVQVYRNTAVSVSVTSTAQSTHYMFDSRCLATVPDKEIKSTFMRKKCCDKYGNVQFYFPVNPDTCLHPLEHVVFKLPIPLCGQTKRSAKLFTFHVLSCLPTMCSRA